MRELLGAADGVYSALLNLCVWNKDNGGMGSLYRSKHELVFVFKKGDASHINNVKLGSGGRYRTNVWDYPGVNSFSGRDDLEMHPTAKSVALIARAIHDCSRRGGIVLDPFWRLRVDIDRRGAHRPQGSSHRVRPALLRYDRPPLAT